MRGGFGPTVCSLTAEGVEFACPGCQAQATPGLRAGRTRVYGEVGPGPGRKVEPEEVAERLACDRSEERDTLSEVAPSNATASSASLA